MNKGIIVTLQFSMFHRWEEAPDIYAFLRNNHRHIFYVVCKRRVTDNNREIEFIHFKSCIEEYIYTNYKDKELKVSCEDVAEDLIKQFDLYYCSVMEDNENGAEIFE